MMVAVRLSVSVIPRLADENLILTYDEHESYCGTDSYTRNPATLVPTMPVDDDTAAA